MLVEKVRLLSCLKCVFQQDRSCNPYSMFREGSSRHLRWGEGGEL